MEVAGGGRGRGGRGRGMGGGGRGRGRLGAEAGGGDGAGGQGGGGAGRVRGKNMAEQLPAMRAAAATYVGPDSKEWEIGRKFCLWCVTSCGPMRLMLTCSSPCVGLPVCAGCPAEHWVSGGGGRCAQACDQSKAEIAWVRCIQCGTQVCHWDCILKKYRPPFSRPCWLFCFPRPTP
jgi:hypothetical protein